MPARHACGDSVTKPCSVCGIIKDISEFQRRHNACNSCRSLAAKEWRLKNPNAAKKYRSDPQAKIRARGRHLLNEYGLTLAGFEKLLVSQDYKCAVCDRPYAMITDTKCNLVVDHCHTTGEIRGLLCNTCNTTIGHMKDDPNRLRRMADYIEKWM